MRSRSTRLISLVPLESKTDNEVTLEQIVHSLESLPGWVCLEEHSERADGVASPSSSAGPKRVRRKGVSAEGESLIFEAEEAQDGHGLMPGSLDYLTFGVARSTVELSSGGWKIFRRMGFFFQHQVSRCLEWRYQTALLLIFAAFRALIPRLWCTFYFGRSFVPEDPYIATMVWHGFCLTWFIGFAWLAILNNARMAYSECVIQMRLTSALVHLEKRHAYLKSLLDEGTLTEDEFRTLSRKLPYISMDVGGGDGGGGKGGGEGGGGVGGGGEGGGDGGGGDGGGGEGGGGEGGGGNGGGCEGGGDGGGGNGGGGNGGGLGGGGDGGGGTGGGDGGGGDGGGGNGGGDGGGGEGGGGIGGGLDGGSDGGGGEGGGGEGGGDGGEGGGGDGGGGGGE